MQVNDALKQEFQLQMSKFVTGYLFNKYKLFGQDTYLE